MAFISVTRALFVSVLAAMGASVCCFGPVGLLALGLAGGAGTLSRVSPYRPLLVGIAVLCLGFALSRIYLVPAHAVNWSLAAKCAVKRQRRWFWWIALGVSILLASPWLAPLLA
ncbi:mercuric transporter MerT family protein [Pseudomonas sp. MOB-449]|nr:mercuric transporter MerT family protein [Pseudomonas sp. MOB-449]